MHKKILSLLVLVVVGSDLSGCASYMTAQGRREMAYRHFVQKRIKQRQRAIARAQKAANRQSKRRMKSVQPSEPEVTSSVQNVPETWSQPVSPPVSVSASNPLPNETDSEPAQP